MDRIQKESNILYTWRKLWIYDQQRSIPQITSLSRSLDIPHLILFETTCPFLRFRPNVHDGQMTVRSIPRDKRVTFGSHDSLWTSTNPVGTTYKQGVFFRSVIWIPFSLLSCNPECVEWNILIVVVLNSIPVYYAFTILRLTEHFSIISEAPLIR